ncbi:MAG: hypothetical protein HY537_14595 [Deltaproteobacteria bacterium]|nr:hypothetical protein [Deltaproteobacteria bacterium]
MLHVFRGFQCWIVVFLFISSWALGAGPSKLPGPRKATQAVSSPSLAQASYYYSPLPSVTATATVTPTPTYSPSPTPSPSPSPSPTYSPSPSSCPTPTTTPTPTPTTCYDYNAVPCPGPSGGECNVTQNPATQMGNGCGTGGLPTWILMTGTAVGCGIIFDGGCQAHDLCYGKCPAVGAAPSQASCDLAFYNDMASYCMSNFSWYNPCRGACLSAAAAYYTAVSSVGATAYANAKSRACKCHYTNSIPPAPTPTCVPGNCTCDCTGGGTATGPRALAPDQTCSHVDGLPCGGTFGGSGTAYNCTDSP